MAKVRIYELAKKLNRNSKDILDELADMGFEGKSHSSSIDSSIADKIARTLAVLEPVEPPPPAIEEPIATPEPVQEEQIKEEIKAEPQTEAVIEPKPAAKKEEPKKAQKLAKPHKDKMEKTIKLEPTLPSDSTLLIVDEPEGEVVAVPATSEKDEDVTVPDRFKKESEAEKIEKFKAKPGLQKAFTSIRKVEPRKWDPRSQKRGFGGSKSSYKQDEKQPVLSTAPRKKNLKLREGMSVKEFAELIGIKSGDVIKKFMALGDMTTTINQPVDTDAALLIAESFGIKLELASVEDDYQVDEEAQENAADLRHRAPVITIMGHVDHGKTSLLDAIRETKVTESEAGGITQHIGAYKVYLKGKDIVFLDTPGHEAFTALRARGAKVTDIVVLVVAADDGVMPQTKEAINHAKAANVPIVVAINKIDKPDANITRLRNELSEQGIISEDWGGHNIFVEVSAKKRIGIEHLLEMILLQAEVLELKANHDRKAKGTIIEAKLDKGRGPVATLLVQAGTLRIGDALLSGSHVGKVRAIVDDTGKRIQEAGPSTPVEVIGFSEVPAAGDVFAVVDDEKKARQIAMTRLHKQRSLEIAKAKKLTLDELYTQIKEGQIKELNIIIKGDVQGSVEAIKDAFENITHPEVKVKVIHCSVGGINESDVMLATASNAIIIGFNVRPETKAAQTAEKEGVDIRLYNIIYEAIDDVKKALEGMLEPTLKEKILGRAEVRQLFPVSRLGTIAGCSVIDGYMTRASDGIRVIRDNVVAYEGKIASLKRQKDDVKEVQTGYECGILIENFNDLKLGDIIENFIIEKIATKL
ncbi:MAG: translation initiation factor IF-2 [Nitrospirae bacterium]|nr:translation initiation factor IF-2 [Nitrospirota bacterium]